jgi:hypothetical protein
MPVWRRVLPSRHELSSHGTAGCLLVVSPQGRAPDAELGPGLALLPPRVKQFMSVDPYFEPSSDGTVRPGVPILGQLSVSTGILPMPHLFFVTKY